MSPRQHNNCTLYDQGPRGRLGTACLQRFTAELSHMSLNLFLLALGNFVSGIVF